MLFYIWVGVIFLDWMYSVWLVFDFYYCECIMFINILIFNIYDVEVEFLM